MESPPPASARGVASPRSHLARSAGKKVKYVDDVSDMDDDSEFELSDAEEEDDDFSDVASEDEEAADKKRKKAAAARKAKAKKRTKVGLDSTSAGYTRMLTHDLNGTYWFRKQSTKWC